MSYRAALRIASWLVARERRREWFAEWNSELWYVRRQGGNAGRFCAGAFRDAWLLRPSLAGVARPPVESPAQCAAVLAAIGAVTMLIALALPAARQELSAQFVHRKTGPGRYRIERVWAKAEGKWGELKYIVRPVAPREGDGLIVPPGSYFGGPGSIVMLSGVRARVIALTTQRSCRLPDAVSAAVDDCGYPPDIGSQHKPGLLLSFVPNLFLACVIVPVASSLRLRDLLRMRRWGFVAAKAGLMTPILFFGGMDLAFTGIPVIVLVNQCSMWGAIFAFRWVLLDQRQRCPVCLRRLGNEVRVGEPSHTFLEWHGTEVMCPRGHGLMHEAESSGLWFSGQRWVALDTSWGVLFR